MPLDVAEQQLPPDDGAPRPSSTPEPLYPKKDAHFSFLDPGAGSFNHDPYFFINDVGT